MRIAILLSVHNGARYVDELLASLASQSVKPDCLYVRDDASTDHTKSIIEKWDNILNIQWIESGEHPLGASRSFLAMTQCVGEFDFYFWCDQDDVWQKDKIKMAVEALALLDSSKPNLYASRLTVVDSELNYIGSMGPSIKPIKYSVPFESVLSGCTMAFNHKLLEIIIKIDPNAVIMHDWICCLVAVFLGELVFDHSETILYRQHDKNVHGARKGLLEIFQKKVAILCGNERNVRSHQLKNMRNVCAMHMNQSDIEYIEKILNIYTQKIHGFIDALSIPIVRQHVLQSLTTRMALLLGYY